MQRLRDWLKVMRSGINPLSKESQLRRKLVNARFVVHPAWRKAAIERIKHQLEKPGD